MKSDKKITNHKNIASLRNNPWLRQGASFDAVRIIVIVIIIRPDESRRSGEKRKCSKIVQWQSYNLQWKIVKWICWFCSHSSWKRMKTKSEKRRWKYLCVGGGGGALKCKTSWMAHKSRPILPCYSMCVHFVNTQIIEKHFCDDAAVLNIPCSRDSEMAQKNINRNCKYIF